MNKEIGKTVSFYELMSNNALKIDIPIIQRDYAQGRNSAKEIRTNFLKTIKNHLDQKKPLNLDFVYGSVENNRFIPIDGQQRLTTLFLLHWYLAWASDNVNHYQTYLGIDSSNFTYKTRISSRDFCNLLISKPLERTPDLSISGSIKNQHWYYLNWKYDSTITGMLNTLDTIEEIFTEPEKYYGLLTQSEPPLITFQYIELKDFGLSDQLYIKMNSRGKPLTEFENLKANVEKIFEEYDKKNDTQFTPWLTSKIDSKWTDLFWSFLKDKSNLVDNLFMNFLRASITNFYALKEDTQEDHLKLLLNSNQQFTYYMLEAVGLDQFEPLNIASKNLDCLTKNPAELYKPIDNISLIDEENLFEDIINDSSSYPKRIQHFALCSFLADEKKDISKISAWMRVIRNLTENSRIEDPEEFANALKTANKLLNYSNDILEYLIKSNPSDFTGYSNYQSSEEILKARLIIFNPAWKERIESFENHPYLQGHIGFILNFSGLEEVIIQSKTSSMEASIENQCLKAFDDYEKKFRALFKDDGIKAFSDFLFERALLSIGDYTLQKNRNRSFLINGNERDISWKRFLRSENRKYLKTLFNHIDVHSIEQSLQSLIDEFDEVDYRYFFIKYPAILAKTGNNKFIRYYNENHILLLEKTQTNGTHREYYSYAVLCELESKGYDAKYQPESFEEYGNTYISKINGNEIYISYFPDGEYKGYWVGSDISDEEAIQFSTHDEVIKFIEVKFPKN